MNQTGLARINASDYPDLSEKNMQLFTILNSFIKDVNSTFLQIPDAPEIHEFSFTTGANYLSGAFSQVSYQTAFKPPQEVRIMQIQADSVVTSATGIDWIYSGSQIIIRYISGFQPLANYTVRIGVS